MAGFYPDDRDPLTPYLGLYGDRRLVGRGRGSPAGLPVQAREADPFQLTRERIGEELDSNPALRRDFDANTTAEVGSNPVKRRMYQAATIDRAVQTGKPLADVVNAPDYYPPQTRRATATTGQAPDPSIWEGANPANYATGNASFDPKTGRWVGFAGGPQTATSGSGSGMELYGIEGQGGLDYARAMGYRGPDRTAIGPGGPRGDDNAAVAGLYEQANAPADYPKREEGKKMPASLMDMLSGNAPLDFSPRDVSGNPIGIGDAISGNANSLIGLGMGLLQPYRPGESPYTKALEGFQAGSVADSNRGYRQAQLQHQKTQDARQAAQDQQSQSNWEKQFARSDPANAVTDFQKAAKDLGLAPNSPEYNQFAKQYYQSKGEGDWQIVQAPHPIYPGETVPVWANKRTRETVPFTPGSTAPNVATATAPQQGPTQPGAAPLAGAAPAVPADGIPPAPPGTDPKEWRKEQTKLLVQKGIADEAKKKQAMAIDPVSEDIDRAINTVTKNPNLTTGMMGGVMKSIGGSKAADLAGLVDTIKANASLDKLQAMRSQSPTGASGLGAVTQGEHKLLQDSIGALEQSQSPEQLLYNLDRVKRVRHEIIHGPGTAPPAAYLPPESQRPPSARQTGGGSAPSAGAVRALKANPQRRDEFDAKYGEGAAMRILRGE